MSNLATSPYDAIARALARRIADNPHVDDAALAAGGHPAVFVNLWNANDYPRHDIAPYIVIQAANPTADAHILRRRDSSAVIAVALRLIVATASDADRAASDQPTPAAHRASPEVIIGPSSERHEALLAAVADAISRELAIAAPGWNLDTLTIRTDSVADHPLQLSAIDVAASTPARTCSGRPIPSAS